MSNQLLRYEHEDLLIQVELNDQYLQFSWDDTVGWVDDGIFHELFYHANLPSTIKDGEGETRWCSTEVRSGLFLWKKFVPIPGTNHEMFMEVMWLLDRSVDEHPVFQLKIPLKPMTEQVFRDG